ncbi:hypothetical protein C8Q74DRAFT_205169 [Fomes fomentarius]|nr:hypothetical protein C8Q74DRAFT_205169 [Fomes fomentarius]
MQSALHLPSFCHTIWLTGCHILCTSADTIVLAIKRWTLSWDEPLNQGSRLRMWTKPPCGNERSPGCMARWRRRRPSRHTGALDDPWSTSELRKSDRRPASQPKNMTVEMHSPHILCITTDSRQLRTISQTSIKLKC